MAALKNPWVRLTLWILAIPIFLIVVLRRTLRRSRFLRLTMRLAITCECGTEVSLVGFWKCSCGFTYKGHLVRACPVCETVPCVIRCYACGVTTKLAEDG